MQCLIIGAGGIGTRLTPLAKVDMFDSFHIFDKDVYEDSNMARQGSRSLIGQVKSGVLKRSLAKLSPKLSEDYFAANGNFHLDRHIVRNTNEPTVVFCTVDQPTPRCDLHKWSRKGEGKRAPDIVIYGMNELQNGEAVLDIPAIPWWPDPAVLYPNSFYDGMDDANRPHCANLQNEGGVQAEQIATINGAIAGDMLWLFEAAMHMKRHPDWVTDPSLEIPLPYAVVTTALGKRTRQVMADGTKLS
jgi:hypothetical protein